MLNRVQTQDGLSRRTLVTLIVAGLGALSLVLFVLPSDSRFGSGNGYAEEKDLEPVLMLAEEKHKQELIDERHSPTADSKPPAEQGKLPEQKEQKEQEQQHEGWPEACKKLWMTDVDRRAYVDTLVEAKVKQYLEWGGGSSTLCAAALVANGTHRLSLLTAVGGQHARHSHVREVVCSHDDRAQQQVVPEAEAADHGRQDHQRRPHLFARGVGELW
jgi:hypothetical protein